jgi:anaerobic sulfite reductase subunit B
MIPDRHSMAPLPYRVGRVRPESATVVTLDVEPLGTAMPAPEPGQFCMLYAYGVGEAPISVSGCPADDGVLRFTIREAGLVTGALCATRPGDPIGVRGPYGAGWPLDDLAVSDLLMIGGGIGIAPLRPVVRRALHDGRAPRRVAVAVGARRPEDLLFHDELVEWEQGGAEVAVTVDAPSSGWRGDVGVVTALLDRLLPDPAATVAMVCGPEVMMRVVAQRLLDAGLDPAAIHVSLERNMHCGIGHCGHCQIGPLFVCLDGPVRPWTAARPLLEVRAW